MLSLFYLTFPSFLRKVFITAPQKLNQDCVILNKSTDIRQQKDILKFQIPTCFVRTKFRVNNDGYRNNLKEN